MVKIFKAMPPFTLLRVLPNPYGSMEAVAYNPTGTQLVAGGKGGKVWIYNGTNPSDPLYNLSVPVRVTNVAYNPEGTRLTVGLVNSQVMIFAGMSPFPLLHNLSVGSTGMAYSPDGTWLVAGGYDGKIKMYKVDVTEAFTEEAFTEASTRVVTEIHNASTLTALSLITLLTAALQGMILQ